jgi:DNA mismatch repair ATPase MutS
MFQSEFIAFEKNINNEWLFPICLLIELVKIVFNAEYLMFCSFLDALTKEKKSIELIYLYIGEIDVAISTASLKSGDLKICTPTFDASNNLNISAIYHPLIESCIPNNVDLLNKSMLLTGSNRSGKSTFIRTVAINSILAQTLHICFAASYTAPYYKVYSSIQISGDLLEGTSYYLQEVLAIKKLIKASKDKNPCLFVLDEIFKGTNTVERISGGKAILSYLNSENNTVLVATRDIELTTLLEKEAYKLYYFSEVIENNNLFFDHKIKEGKLTTRNDIQILDLYKYPLEIITDAKAIEKTYFS